MLKHYIIVFLVSMVPLIELRGAAVYAGGFGLPVFQSFLVCMIGNMIPVPIIYFFARKVLEWGADKPYIGKFFTFCLEKGKKGVGGEIQLTDSIACMLKDEQINSFLIEEKRYDIGSSVGFIDAVIDFAIERDEIRDEVIKLIKAKAERL